MTAGILALVTALLAAIPAILNVLEGRKATRHAMARHSLAELHRADERLRQSPPLSSE